nr:EOG090X0007 [Lepidurus arcticus]
MSCLVHGQGPGPGPGAINVALLEDGAMQSRAVDTRVQLEVREEEEGGKIVGHIPIKPGFTYRFNENPREFRLNGTTGEISTAVVLDREALATDRFDLVVLSSQPTYPIEVRIVVVDINDNAPRFPDPSIHVTFSESANAGTRVILDTATDGDSGDNDVTTDYTIVSGNEEGKFKLAVTTNPSGETPYLHLETTGQLDRESRGFYRLNISARDGGNPPLFGYLLVNVTIVDVNDNPPIFEQSDYVVSLNESLPPGTIVLQVTATDVDAGDNAKIVYYVSETETQFSVDPDTGLITTQEALNCPRNCPSAAALANNNGRSSGSSSSSSSSNSVSNTNNSLGVVGGGGFPGTCPKSCVFTVLARDQGNPRQDGRTYITVNLLDANDHDPIIRFRYFPATADFATVDENAQNGSVVAAVSVIDLDEGPNADSTVEIRLGNELGHFRLEETPSFHIVRVNGVLDREKLSKYNLSILATDNGSPPRSALSFLIIHVNDVNDHEPVFEKSEYSAVLSELVPIGSYVASITATDADTGINSNIHYAIAAGNTHQWFALDSVTGLLTTQRLLDRETQDSIELRISARDGGPNPRWAFTHVKVTLLDENDEAPRFLESFLNVSLSENTPPNTVVALLSAVDHDQGTNGSVTYAFDPEVDARYPGIFGMDPSTGQVATRTKLDREAMPHYDIKVIAKDQGNPPLSATATIALRVLDANDNSPEFYPQHYVLTLSQNMPFGQSLLTLTATDEDEGDNAEITYTLVTAGGDYAQYFTVDEDTGVLQLSHALPQHQQQQHFKLRVAAKDKGDRKAVEDALVEIWVKPGDKSATHSPVLAFTHPEGYAFAIAEDPGKKEPSIGRQVGRIQLASGNNNASPQDVKFSIVDGDSARVFAIQESTGWMTTAKRVDREVQAQYTLKIVARTQASYAFVFANVSLTDVNDNPPRFLAPRVKTHVAENMPPGHPIYLAAADDVDAGNNSLITYALTLNPQEFFTIAPTSGMISLARPLRPSLRASNAPIPSSALTQRRYTLEITATDSGSPPLTSRQTLTVYVDDVNDHTPIFEYASYETSLPESVPVNERFYSLTARDADLGPNGRLVYSISTEGNDNDHFGIFPDGSLYVKSPLDREVLDYYALTVQAIDNGSPPRSASVSLTIHVIDENDNAPKFVNDTFNFAVPENAVAETYIGKVSAEDADAGRNAELTFALVPSPSSEAFQLDPKTGFLKSLRPFDREKLLQTAGRDQLVLEAIVTDNGVQRLRDRARLVITVTDVNDNPPVFIRLPYKASISEGAALETQIFRVAATDQDDGPNGQLGYSIVAGNAQGQFRIDESTGQVWLAKPLDRETVLRYVLTISATDAGIPRAMNASANLTIDVLDENDNAPEFAPQNPTSLALPETTAVGAELVTFAAQDADLGAHSEVTYFIGAGNVHDAFRMDPSTGKMYLEKPLDYETTHNYRLNITATDGGNPRLSAVWPLVIRVLDANDNAPHFPATALVRQIQEGIPLLTPIVTVTAEDPDAGPNGQLRYSLVQLEPQDGPHFAVRPETGVVYVTRAIDREFADTFKLTVIATDQAIPPSARLSAEKLVTVIVEDVNDNAPVFASVNAGLLPPNAGKGYSILKVSAMDADANTNGLVTYELVAGDIELFSLDRTSGWLTLRKAVSSPETQYRLTVRATDEAVHAQRKSTETTLTVLGVGAAGLMDDTTISHGNSSTQSSSGPAFSKPVYASSVAENEPIGTSVISVSAKSIVHPLAEIEYYVVNISASQGSWPSILPLAFDLDPKTGLLSTAASLDREVGVEEYALTVVAVTLGTPTPQTSLAKVLVKVLDKNDSPPVWAEPEGVVTVSEELGVGQVVTSVSASDADALGVVTYELVGGDEANEFSLEASTGFLRLRLPLDREVRSQYKLRLRASDGEQHADTTLPLNVLDTNDNAPVFPSPAYSFDIPEDAGRGAWVGAVSAEDPDEGVNAQVSYTVLSDWGNDVFSLNPQSGVFTLTSRLDYEQVQHYMFVVQAQDAGRPSLSSTVTVYFNVQDLNDNAPLFDPMSYSEELYENVTIGTSILTVFATDQDSGENGRLTYSISGGDEKEQFGITGNGTLFTRQALDREEQSLYNLVVMATDIATPPTTRLSSTVQVTIILKDVNDMAPEFVSPPETSVLENTPVNTVVMAVKAVDRDEGRNSYIEYALGRTSDSRFSVGPVDGLLRVAAPLDRELRSNYTLTVTAHDRGAPSKSTTQEITITVLDENDNSPVFEPKIYAATVAENASLGLSVLQVTATDLDESLNGRLRYSIVAGDPNRDWSVGEDTGILRVSKQLNFERQAQYVLTVQAEDSGAQVRYDAATVRISVTDVNDNAPTFLDSPYEAYVMENNIVPSSVLTVTAFDADAPPHNQIRYLLKEEAEKQGFFRVNATTGEIVVLRPLDREFESTYALTIIAIDTGIPSLTGSGTVVVHVADVNDETPVFAHTNYVGSIPEDAAPGTSVLSVSASDQDEGINAVIRYSLSGGNAKDFIMDPATGVISTATSLDHEKVTQYRLQVTAVDSSPTHPRSAHVNVTITVADVNDNRPKFTQNLYHAIVPDAAAPGHFVFGASADDPDLGVNGKIVYQLSGPDADKFVIQRDTGVLKTFAGLSGNSNGGSAIFRVEIRATDSGVPALSTSANLEVRLQPAALFPGVSAEEATFTLAEDTELRVLTKVTATSPKSGAKAQLSYSIAGGNVGHVFDVNNRTGQVSVVKPLDFETTRQYELWIAATDADSPALSSALKLSINVTDANDNAPIFDQVIYNASILEEQFPPQLVLTVHATDADAGRNAQVMYQLKSDTSASVPFTLEPRTGKLIASSKLDREDIGFYALTVEAVDAGSPARTGTATVLITVADKNDNPPRFTRLFSVNVTENAPIGTFVIQVTSSDRDLAANANATYSLTENPQGKFHIDPVSGNVTVAGVLDREAREEYLLKVSAVDGSWRAETPLTITVQDTNDNAPEFEQNAYSFSFPESQAAQGGVAFVGRVSAIDKDKPGQNSVVGYSLKQPSDWFSVDPASGDIFSKTSVRYKATSPGRPTSPENAYLLAVIASDQGKPPLSSECMLTILVVNANNHAPKFEQASYWSPVPETATLGQKVLHLRAVDAQDFGLNAQIEYRKLGGNGSDFFHLDRETGWVSVNGPLVGRKDLELVLLVRAADMGVPPRNDDTQVRLIVTGENRHAPVFTALSYQVIVPESEPPGATVVTVTATDADSGPNGQLRYSIAAGNDEGKFDIDAASGVVSVRQGLDYDTTPKFVLNITAVDLGFDPQTAAATLTVLLVDVNDNPPRFSQKIYEAEVAENSPVNTFVIELHATDADSPKNAVIQYSIVGGSGKDVFSLGPDTGIVRTKAVFDYEQEKEYVLDVLAVNPDSPLSITAQLLIHVTGRNEYFPHFGQPVFQFTVSESAPVGSSVGYISATDRDGGEDGQVYYLFVGSSNDRGFAVQPETGLITVARSLDRESQSRAVLTVWAKNSGSIRGNDTDEAQVIIAIQDGNDPPVFVQALYSATVSEDVEPGTQVVTVLAVDKDVRPPNNQFSYTLLAGNIDSAFRIDPISGTIETAGKLDRESLPTYNLTVGAVDNGIPSQTGITQVHISLTDVNDNGPVFYPDQEPTGTVTENAPADSFVLNLSATDPDLPPNAGPFTFQLIGGDHPSFFQVDAHSGVVRTTKPLDRETTAELLLLVQISDSGTPKQKSQWPVRIRVLDQNDNPSTPRTAHALIYTLNDHFPGGKVADVRPNDPDSSGDYQCRLVSGPAHLFSLRTACYLEATKFPHQNGNYSIKVLGNDGAHSDVTSVISLQFASFDNVTLDHSIPIRFWNTSGLIFLSQHYKRFLETVSGILGPDSTFMLYSIHVEKKHVDVTVAARRNPASTYWSKSELLETLERHTVDLTAGTLPLNFSLNFSPCDINPCAHEGVCSKTLHMDDQMESIDSPSFIFTSPLLKHQFKCLCARGFSGDSCQLRQDPCLPSPCQHGGTCTRRPGSPTEYECTCSANYAGPQCEREKTAACLANPCRNGGSCQATPDGNGYFCLCRPGYRGAQCEVASDACRPNPCRHGGTCVNLKPGYRCQCPDHFYGVHCDHSAFGLAPLSYLAFPALEPTTNDISITFATNQPDALLVYNFGLSTGGRSDFIAMELVNGKPRFRFGGTQTAIASLEVDKYVADGKWYRLTATRNGRVGSLTVGQCAEAGEACQDCQAGDRSCSAGYSGTTPTGTLNFSQQPLYIGGIPSIEPIQERPGQVQADDFVGCMQSVVVNGRSLNLTAPLSSRGVSSTCPRRKDVCTTIGNSACGPDAQCVDRWSSWSCMCPGGVTAPNCHTALEAVTLSEGSFLELRLSEKHRRRQVMATLGHVPRWKRDTMLQLVNRLTLAFRTVTKDGVLLYAASNADYTLVQLRDGFLHYSSRLGSNAVINMSIPGKQVSNGEWHTLEILSRPPRSLRLLLDDEEVGEELESGSVHDPLDPYLTALYLGGKEASSTPLLPYTSTFEGCLGNLTINGEVQPLNGSSYSITSTSVEWEWSLVETVTNHGKVLPGCNNQIAGAATAPDPLRIGITLVIVFFVILLVAILVSFVVVRLRRQRRDIKAGAVGHAPHLSKPSGALLDRALGSRRGGNGGRDGEMGDVTDEVLRTHLTQELAARKFREREVTEQDRPQRPDIIEREAVNPSPGMPLRVDDSHFIDRNSISGMGGLGGDSEAPEHYDLENASSIAPSDIDIVYHYKSYRDGNVRKYKTNPHLPPAYHKHNHRHSPHSFVAPPHRESPRHMMRASPAPGGPTHPPPPRESPGVLKMQSTPLARLSPSSELSQQTPRILTLQDLSGKPLQTALLATAHQGSGVKDVMSTSERSLNSPVSQMSQSSTGSLRNSSQVTTTKKKKKKQPSNSDLAALGLTADDLDRLQQHHVHGRGPNNRNSSLLVSTLDAVSSSDEDQSRSPEKLADLMETNTEMLETADSSTDESGNDSFTCSEFEYENNYEKVTRDFGPGNMIFSKLAEVDNEHEAEGDNNGHHKHGYDGFDSFRGSLSTLVASDDDLSNMGSYKPPNGSALGWDYLLNWGPNFQSLMGVFKDIAELPDTTNGRVSVTRMGLAGPKPSEEYV